MAPAADSSYFPSLDKCLAGETRLISWRTAYRALCEEEAAVANTNLERFLSDDETIGVFSNALDAFPTPTARSASELDTKTAPINVSQTTNADYNLSEIKEDARWLSREVQIEELVALRMAIIEWQERPADQLLNTAHNGPGGLSNAANLASSALAKSTFTFTASTTGVPRPALDFAKEDVRHRRQIDVYLSEKHHVLKLVADLVTRSAVGKDTVQGQHTGALREHVKKNWIDNVAGKVTERFCSTGRVEDNEAFIARCIMKIDSSLEKAGDSSKWPKVFVDDQTKAQSYLDSQCSELGSVLRILLANLYAFDGVPGPAIVKAWFEAMEKHQFLQDGRPFFAGVDALQLLISIISVEILKLQLAIGEIVSGAGIDVPVMTGNSFIKDDETVTFLNTMLHQCALKQLTIAAPAIFAWSVVTSVIRDIAAIHREVRESRGVPGMEKMVSNASRRGSLDYQSEFEKRFDKLRNVENDPPLFFASAAVDRMDVFGLIQNLSTAANTLFSSDAECASAFICKESLLDLMRDGIPFVRYDAPVLEAILSILAPWETSLVSRQHAQVLAEKFLYDNDQLRPAIVDQALARFPYEYLPLVRLFTLLASAENKENRRYGRPMMVEILENLQTITLMVSEHFFDYQLVHDDDTSNEMVLTADLPVFSTRRDLLLANESYGRRLLASTSQQHQEQETFTLGAGTPGVIVKETRPFVFKLEHRHSGLEYLGLMLSTFAASGELVSVAPDSMLDRPTAADTVSLFSALLAATLKHNQGVDEAIFVLGRLSSSLNSAQDIVTVIAEILETELLAHLDQRAQEGSIELATACAQFLKLMVKVSPERVWSILARSSLLGVVDGATSLASVVGGTEVQIGRYTFLQACVELHAILLEDAIAGLVKRKAQPQRSGNRRFAETTQSLDSTPERTMSAVLNAFQKILLDAFQNIPDWKFVVPQERCTISTSILKAFTKLLKSTYGVDIAKEPSKRLTNALGPAAEALLSACAPKNDTSLLLKTFSRIFSEGLPVAEDSLPVDVRALLVEQTKSAFNFLTILVRATKAGIELLANPKDQTLGDQKRSIKLSADLLKNVPVLASLLASDHAFKADLFSLLSELVQTVGSGEDDPPSLLAQLDPEASKSFLMVMTQLDRPLCDVQVERQVWDFLSVVLTSKQQWFAIYLITGALPKKRSQRGKEDPIRGKPILSYVLDQLSTITVLPPERATGMLKFLSTAQQSWVWATSQLRSHPDFLKNTLAWVDTLGAAPRDPSPSAAIVCAKECEMAAYLCDIFAINVHASLEIGDKTILKSLVTKLSFLRDQGGTVNAYNRSLHKNLARNLKEKFPQSELSDFQRTEVNPAPFGTEYFYDRDFATRVLSHDASWHGANRALRQGFSNEFSLANANLSLLHAQTKLLKSWKMLATTLCDCADQDHALQLELAKVAEKCLLANSNPQVDEPGVADVLALRIELAFVLISKLVGLKVQAGAMSVLLPAAWDLVRTSPVDYDVATAQEDIRYYRELLQVLYLTVQPHSYLAKACQSRPAEDMQFDYLAPATASILVDIVGKTITPGFRALCSNLHSDMDLALPADFALLTALLQAVLSVPGVSSVYTLLADIVASSSVVRGALSLYSWADRLAETTAQDPIYGEIAVMFLLGLSTVPPIAEQMALEGTLTQLSAGNLSNYFRKPGGKGPFDEPQRTFLIWTEGFLPLCLNFLDSVGPAIAAEVSAFLNSFREQLSRAETALQNEAPSPRNPKAGAITLSLVSEAHSLSMIALILNSDMARGAADGISAADISPLDYDFEGVKGLVDGLARQRRSLSDRITPVSSLEERWLKTPVNGASDNLLSQKVLREVLGMIACFGSESS